MSRQSDELRAYFDKHGIKQKDVREATGASHSTISNILSGRFGISKDMAHKLAQVYGFDVSFLLSGEGSLMPPPGVSIQHIERVRNSGNIVNGSADAALRAEVTQLRERLEKAEEEKARLLGIIETMTGR